MGAVENSIPFPVAPTTREKETGISAVETQPAPSPQDRDPYKMSRAELEAYLHNTDYFPTKTSLLEFTRRYDVPANARTHREEIVRLCLRIIHDIPASFAGLRATEQKLASPPQGGGSTRKTLTDFFTGVKADNRPEERDGKHLSTDLVDGLSRCYDTGALLAQAHSANPAPLRQMLETNESQLRTHLRFLGNLVDLARLESGKDECARVPFHVRECITAVTRRHTSLAQQKQLTLSCNIQADVPERLVGDPERLQQVIFNLVDNAIKFTARGEVVIQVTAEEQPEQHPSDSTNAPQGHNGGAVVLHVSVRDTGRGLPSEQLQAFTQWFATGNATSLAPTSGLGLPLAQRLVLAMGGSLEMSSEANGGTTCSFSVRLQNDLAQEDDAPPRPTVLRDLRRLVEEEAFDRDALWALVDGDAALLQELIGSFELDCGRFLFALQHAVATENSHDLLAAVGALQDTVNQFAAHAAARVLTEIERTGDQGHFAQVREALPFLLSELSRLKTALDALAQDISASAPAKNF